MSRPQQPCDTEVGKVKGDVIGNLQKRELKLHTNHLHKKIVIMPIQIDAAKFQAAHEMFMEHMCRSWDGVPFTDFQHPFLMVDETEYKRTVHYDATQALGLRKWKQWKKTSGKILQATKGACRKSGNLLEHHYGLQNSSEKALYRVESPQQVRGLEHQLFDFFLGGPSTPAEFGPRFDALADYLRENSLGCRWDFMSYLAFLLRQQTYFPIRPNRFDVLLRFYGIAEPISGVVSWDKYSVLLELADTLKARLAMYGQADAIQIQSYMWVVSYLLQDPNLRAPHSPTVPDFNSELIARAQRAKERERIGVLGEQFIYEQEKTKLKKAGHHVWASKVSVVSLGDDMTGFDILSFDLTGKELHIEVKTTTRSPADDNGFWLSQTEKRQAEKDGCWIIYRVWNIDSKPSYKNLGNIVTGQNKDWKLEASTWYVERNHSTAV